MFFTHYRCFKQVSELTYCQSLIDPYFMEVLIIILKGQDIGVIFTCLIRTIKIFQVVEISIYLMAALKTQHKKHPHK